MGLRRTPPPEAAPIAATSRAAISQGTTPRAITPRARTPRTTTPRARTTRATTPRSGSSDPTAHLQRAAEVLQVLDTLDASTRDEITIIKISEPISSALHPTASKNNMNNINNSNNNGSHDQQPSSTAPRTSDVSTHSASSALDAPTPASLEADLAHYKELFAKLRFSYVEQVTKEKFIRAIVGDPPLIVTPQENADLEASNVAAKASLKALKTEVALLVEDLESRSRELAARYERVKLDQVKLRELPAKMEELQKRVDELRTKQAIQPGSLPEMNLPLAKTAVLVEERRQKVRDLERQVEQLSSLAPRKRKEMERLQMEVTALAAKRTQVSAAAREAKRRRENAQKVGGADDEMEAKGRWYRASEAALRELLGLKE
ncbi:hypothetical protein QBC32DRAFT_65158 [Pseudoneurospora amorphoporcata]|uniref:Kinetochore protein Sos7 coiled-coil domain-containing protein n=1 Tax=Pseudoneurospora amorphoporcata TaxID=241081 RepID=A0AAN6NZK2_9PEZI|nr:hypothetical protein QBC32DRAFT_65158 [Pseudoneurospora amorphoporcata]